MATCTRTEYVGDQLLRQVDVYDIDTKDPTDPSGATWRLIRPDGTDEGSWQLGTDPEVTNPDTGVVRFIAPTPFAADDVGQWTVVATTTTGGRDEVDREVFQVEAVG